MRPRTLAVAALLVLALGSLAGALTQRTVSAFSGVASNSSPTLRAATDWTPPSVSRSTLAKSAGGDVGYIRPGGTYYAYAQVADGGNPPAGVASVSGDAGLGAIALTSTGGPWTVGGQSYNYRSAQQTLGGTVPAGTYPSTVAMSDSNSPVNSQSQAGASVVVDATAPTGQAIQTTNGGSTAGQAEQNDTVVFTFSEPIGPISVLAGWDGSSTPVTVRIANDVSSADRIQIRNAANSAQLPITSTNGVNLGRTDYVTTNRDFTNSTMVRSGNTVTITLGTPSGATSTAAATGTMTWTPPATLADRAGNALTSSTVTESGTADKDF